MMNTAACIVALDARVATMEKDNAALEKERDALAARAKKSEEERRDQDRSFDALAARVATLEEALKFARQAIDKNSRDGRIAMRALATIDAALGEPK